jgi:hypothetical protein
VTFTFTLSKVVIKSLSTLRVFNVQSLLPVFVLGLFSLYKNNPVSTPVQVTALGKANEGNL